MQILVSLSIVGVWLAQPGAAAFAMGAPDVAENAPTIQGITAVVNVEGADLLPAPNGQPTATLAAGDMVTVTGRSQDGAWLFVEPETGQSGWLAAAQVIVFGLEKVPVLPVEAAAASMATPTTVQDDTPSTESTDTDLNSTEVTTTTTTTTTALSSTAPVTSTVAADADAALAHSAGNAAMQAQVSLASGRLNIRSGPGTSYGIIGKAQTQDSLNVLARDATGQWLEISLPGQETEIGWVSASYVQPMENMQVANAIAELPVSDKVSDAPAYSAANSQAATPAMATASAVDAAAPAQAAAASETTAEASPANSASTASGSATGLTGTLVFQTNPGGTIYAYDLQDGRVWSLTHGFDPAISPDGSTVAFTRDGGENGIYLISINGGSERLIFSGRSSLASPKWSPDGQWILFSRGDEYWQCRTLGFGTCVSGNLAGAPGMPLPPGFSLDDLPIKRTQEFNLAVVDTNGDNYHDIAALETARTPDWNEAGIVYQSSAGIQRTDDKPDAENTLVSFDYLNPYYYDPDWQPNGGRILFQMRGASHWEIYSINPDGSNMTNLTRPVTALVDALPSNVAPAWSPDGQHIVYASNRGADNSAGPWRLWVMDADGGNQHPLPLDVEIDYTFGGEQIVSWGP
ncbi:MAG: PD40 domain-containing protein [Caldilineaceae bacterium]|nr:PD40 domain-containing protein [Caldilineaceae bacterium]